MSRKALLIDELRGLLTLAVRMYQERDPLQPLAVPVDAPAGREFVSFDHQEALMLVYERASHSFRVASDHLLTLGRSTGRSPNVFGAFAAGRSCLEQVALTTWLLDPAVDARRRVNRLWGLREHDLQELIKFARCAGQAEALEGAQGHLQALRDEAGSVGVATTTARNGSQSLGERLPGYTDLHRDMLGFDDGYRLFSGVAHGTLWATARVGMQTNRHWTPDARLPLLKKRVDPTAVQLVLRTALQGYVYVGHHVLKTFGWDAPGFLNGVVSAAESASMETDWLGSPPSLGV